MSEKTLIVLMEGRRMGVVTQKNNRMRFEYDDAWAVDDTPLSLSMPPAIRQHSHTAIACFMWGLLTDNEETLSAIGREHHVSPRNPFALLSVVGHDCAGAVQFVRPEDLETVQHGGGIEPISDEDIEAELRSLRVRRGGGKANATFSLAGAQPKVAYTRIKGRWFQPSGRMATTHILKPSSDSHDGLIENEHFCLQLANRIGWPLVAATSEIGKFGDETAIISTRYDRAVDDTDTLVVDRIHQEDMCQALSVRPDLKYEKDGGPGIAKIMRVISGSNSPEVDRDRFMRCVIFNFVIKGTDAHAKNYSVIHLGDQYRLAPFYDIASILPYSEFDPHEIKSSMRIGKHYKFNDIMPRHWEETAKAALYNADKVMNDISYLIRTLPDHAHNLAKDTIKSGLDHPIISKLTDEIEKRCLALRRVYQG